MRGTLPQTIMEWNDSGSVTTRICKSIMANVGKGNIASTKRMVCSNRVTQLMSPGKLLLHGHT